MASKTRSSQKVLALELKRLEDEPVEGFLISLVNDSNLYEWKCIIFGPPDTIYAGAYFKAVMRFPYDYPYGPPNFRFLNKMYHPNIYDNGEVCISILHPPTDDPQSGELPSERWNPTQTVRTVLLSVISLLMEPNISSPANVDAGVMYRRFKEGNSKEYEVIVNKLVAQSKQDAVKDNVVVPKTQEEYCINSKTKQSAAASRSQSIQSSSALYEMDDMFDDEYYESYSEDEDSTTIPSHDK
jgi:ubiquitin-conjugating enzyme E2 R